MIQLNELLLVNCTLLQANVSPLVKLPGPLKESLTQPNFIRFVNSATASAVFPYQAPPQPSHDIGCIMVGSNGCPPTASPWGTIGLVLVLPCVAENDVADRSEERRVGKECRSRWSP